MNILTERLPSTVTLDGKEYELDTDFRTAIKTLAALEDRDLLEHEKYMLLLHNLYDKEIPPDAQKACDLAVWFLSCGDSGAGGIDAGCGKLYDFGKDAQYIYAAIRQTHGIDLDEVERLHWWKFNYLLFDLREDCFFQRLIALRAKRATGRLTKEERNYCARISDILDLPTQYTEEEQGVRDTFMELLEGATT